MRAKGVLWARGRQRRWLSRPRAEVNHLGRRRRVVETGKLVSLAGGAAGVPRIGTRRRFGNDVKLFKVSLGGRGWGGRREKW